MRSAVSANRFDKLKAPILEGLKVLSLSKG